jgi:hypothetical protein
MKFFFLANDLWLYLIYKINEVCLIYSINMYSANF